MIDSQSLFHNSPDNSQDTDISINYLYVGMHMQNINYANIENNNLKVNSENANIEFNNMYDDKNSNINVEMNNHTLTIKDANVISSKIDVSNKYYNAEFLVKPQDLQYDRSHFTTNIQQLDHGSYITVTAMNVFPFQQPPIN
ncbi:hypothetical protein [Candidatus Neoehrlichia procyonis]|uniref:Uncharacterized protein n=1 Tax=Candidatus Neoehrlichia procyonis str. RAC413 TaxID=1359163 RepID=A0A0F3NNC4_9RICK|nr:hypothetical protein [Candidatus Neoehrlichia lotoris]KJV69266.1 hypothetical protein NLO413_0649 [Candidatus Neoehrlichia lotoris str. RAC413]